MEKYPTPLSFVHSDGASHDFILLDAHHAFIRTSRLATVANVEVFDEAKTERTTSVLITSEFCNGSLGIVTVVELNDSGTFRAAVWFVLDLRLLNLADGLEQLDQVIITSGPGQL